MTSGTGGLINSFIARISGHAEAQVPNRGSFSGRHFPPSHAPVADASQKAAVEWQDNDAEIFSSLARKAASVQSRRAKRVLERRLVELRKHKQAATCLPVAKANAEALEEQISRLMGSSDPATSSEEMPNEFKGAEEAADFTQRYLMEKKSKDDAFYANTLPLAQVKQDEIVRELRRASSSLSQACEDSLRTHGSIESADTILSNALADSLPKLLKICIDELASGGHNWKNGMPEAWEKQETVLLCDLLPLANSSGYKDANAGPVVIPGEFGRGISEAELHDVEELVHSMRDLEKVSSRLSEYLVPQAPLVGKEGEYGDSRTPSTSWIPPTASTREPSGRMLSTSSTTPADMSARPGQVPERDELQRLLEELQKERQTLELEKNSKFLVSRLYKEQLQRVAVEKDSSLQLLTESKEQHNQLCGEMIELSSLERRLKTDAERHRGEWKETHRELESELLCHDAQRQQYQKELQTKRTLEEAIKKAKVAPGVAVAAAVWEEEQRLSQLRAEIAATYAALAAAVARAPTTADGKDHNARKAAALKKKCADLKAENDALRVAADMLEAAADRLVESPPPMKQESKFATAASFARLPNGGQVDLTSKVQMQEQEKTQLRERLRTFQESQKVRRISSASLKPI